MSRRIKAKPKSPEQIALERIARRARDLEAVNIQPEAAALERWDCVVVAHNERDKVDNARRVDVFLALCEGMGAGAYDAARRLERDMHLRAGTGDRHAASRVDCDGMGPGATDLMVDAGKRVDAVLARIGARDAWLFDELIRPSIDRGGWRASVAYVTGEENPVAQAACVRQACQNLAAAYRAIDARRAY